jgi:spermidine synthase
MMHLIPQYRRVQSEKNGTIVVRQWLSMWGVYVGAWEESGPYMRALWRDALDRLPAKFDARNVLLLGLGGGASIRDVEVRFPDAPITAIEWDPAMADIAREIHDFAREPRILVGDIVEVVPQLSEKFGLVLVDCFSGNEPAPSLFEPRFLSVFEERLQKGGRVILNASRSPELIQRFQDCFEKESEWRFRNNVLALFRAARDSQS